MVLLFVIELLGILKCKDKTALNTDLRTFKDAARSLAEETPENLGRMVTKVSPIR